MSHFTELSTIPLFYDVRFYEKGHVLLSKTQVVTFHLGL